MATANRSKKILEKARKLASKTKKKKSEKPSSKKVTTHPEGQNAPQSKKYTQESDKTLSAKATGWRWTKEGAKKAGRDVNSKPSQSDIEKYRNETFTVKGKVNKSGPKGVGDGSFRYLYVERRADKADLKRTQKLAKGGKTKEFIDRKEIIGEKIGNWEAIDNNGISIIWESPESDYYFYATPGFDGHKGLPIQVGKNNDDDFGIVMTSMNDKAAYDLQEYFKEVNKVIDILLFTKKELSDFKDDFKGVKNQSYAKGGTLHSDEVSDFKSYVKGFYGNKGLYKEYFPPKGASNDEIDHAIEQYVAFAKSKDGSWGGGDSMDREMVRDIMLYNRGQKKGLEFDRGVKEVMTFHHKKEYGGILEPMIGGVNQDPRFDIYNTAMFAEKGAMLELGGENPDEKLKVTIHVDVYEDDYENGEGKSVNSYTVDWLKNPIVDAKDLLKYLSNNVYLSDDPNDYVIDEEGYIHTSRLEDNEGSEASKNEIEKWKNREIKLYSAHYLIIVEAVSKSRKPSQLELHNATGIQLD